MKRFFFIEPVHEPINKTKHLIPKSKHTLVVKRLNRPVEMTCVTSYENTTTLRYLVDGEEVFVIVTYYADTIEITEMTNNGAFLNDIIGIHYCPFDNALCTIEATTKLIYKEVKVGDRLYSHKMGIHEIEVIAIGCDGSLFVDINESGKRYSRIIPINYQHVCNLNIIEREV